MKFTERKSEKEGFIEGVLETRGIDDVARFRNLQHLNVELSNPLAIKDIRKAYEMLKEVIDNKGRIGVFVDSDADGYCSASMLIHYIESNYNLPVYSIVPDKKVHGISQGEEYLNESGLDLDLLLVPDSSANDIHELDWLASKGIKTIVIDHHIIEDEKSVVYQLENVVLLSNQWSDSTTNKELTGAGMVFQFLRAFEMFDEDNHLLNDNHFTYPYEITLFAVGQIADASDISDEEIRHIMMNGLQSINPNEVASEVNNNLISEFFGKELPSPHDLSFSVIPRINAITRIGNQSQRQQLIDALSGRYDNTKTPVKKRRKNPATKKMQQIEVMEDMYTQTKTMMDSVKTKQDNYVKKIVGQLETESCAKFAFSEIKPKDNKYPSVTGLIANKFINKYQKPALVLYSNPDNPQELIGSARGFEKLMPDFKAYCEGTNKFNWCQGHENAFGVSIQTLPLLELMNQEKEELNPDVNYTVDKIYTEQSSMNQLKDDVNDIVNNMTLFGGRVSEPVLGFKSLQIPKKLIRVRGSMFTAMLDGIDFVCYNNPEIIGEIQRGFNSDIFVNILGKASINDWGGKITHQVVCEDIEIVDAPLMTTNSKTQFQNGFLDF